MLFCSLCIRALRRYGARWAAVIVAWSAALIACAGGAPADSSSPEFSTLQAVVIEGYAGNAMEPFITPDGRYMLFNNLNSAPEDTNLHLAERIDDLRFRYRGELKGTNSKALDAVASMDRGSNLYFVSTATYFSTLQTLFVGHFVDGLVTNVQPVAGVSRKTKGWLNFDAGIDADGNTLYFVDARFGARGPETADLVIAERLRDGFARLRNSDDLLRRVNTAALEYAPFYSTTPISKPISKGRCAPSQIGWALRFPKKSGQRVSKDGKLLLFTRLTLNRSTPEFATFAAVRSDRSKPFGEPARLSTLDGYVEAPTFTPDERAIYVHRKLGERFSIARAARVR